MPITRINVNPIGAQRVGVPFVVTGAFFITTIPLTYHDDNGAFTPTNKHEVAGRSTYSFTHPGFPKAGTYTVTVGDGSVKATSNKFTVR